MAKKSQEGITAKREEDFSEWFTQVIQKCELADDRYNIKGFTIFTPWSAKPMELMYRKLQSILEKKGHKQYFMPTLIPEQNFKKESSHVEGFTPEVFWVTQGGKTKLPEKLALRPTSETAFYQMFALWIRSYKDLPLKTYQRAQVFRYETKATRPFLRGREFHWIETHCAHKDLDSAFNQVKEDMQTSQEFLHDFLGLPFMTFERPAWDKFAGAHRTFAAEIINPNGKVLQQPSTHIISPEFAKAFGIKYTDKDEKEKDAWTTCYGPAISRIFASVVITHGDNKGLKFPFEIAPIKIMIVPIDPSDKKLLKKSEELRNKLEMFGEVEVDLSDKSPGEKFNHWEMKGIPIRIDLGLKDLDKKQVTLFRRDLDKKIEIKETNLIKEIEKIGKEFTKNLTNEADKVFEGRIEKTKDLKEIEKALDEKKIAKTNFCSVDEYGRTCAEKLKEKIQGAEVRGTILEEKDKPTGKCPVCGKPAKAVVYVARSY